MNSMNKNGKNDFGLFALVFSLIFGVLFGAYKLIIGAIEGLEVEKLCKAIDKLYLEGQDESTIANALIVRAHEQLGDKLTGDQMNKLKKLVLVERLELEREGKLLHR